MHEAEEPRAEGGLGSRLSSKFCNFFHPTPHKDGFSTKPARKGNRIGAYSVAASSAAKTIPQIGEFTVLPETAVQAGAALYGMFCPEPSKMERAGLAILFALAGTRFGLESARYFGGPDLRLVSDYFGMAYYAALTIFGGGSELSKRDETVAPNNAAPALGA